MSLRSEWVDVSKGIAISLVVFGHAWRGIYKRGLIEEPVFRTFDTFIYSFHMPLFFLISGFFFFSTVQRGSFRTQSVGVTRRLLIPMILWTYIFLTLRWGASDFTNARPDYTSLFVIPIPGVLHFWFLWALWVIQIFFLAIAACLPLHMKKEGFVLAAFGIAIGIWAFAPYLPLRSFLEQAYDHIIFFVSGALLYKMLNVCRINLPVTLIAAFSFVALIPMTQYPELTRMAETLVAVAMSVSVLIVIKYLSERVSKNLLILKWMGAFSFAIYMMHTIFSAGIREILLSLDVTSLGVHLVLGLVFGIVLPIAVSLGLANTRFSELLGFRPKLAQAFRQDMGAKT